MNAITRIGSRTSSPIFIVGPSRSGTTMLGAALSLHPDVCISSETHYFDDLRLRMAGYERSDLSPQRRRACEDYFMKLTYGVYGNAAAASWTEGGGNGHKRRAVDRDELSRLAQAIGPGADSYFEAACRMQAGHKNARRWGEKTPRHVYRIDEIMQRYPDAQVICMVRDPRAVAASYREFSHKSLRDDSRWQQEDNQRIARSYHPLIMSLLWRAAMKAGWNAQHRYGPERVQLQRYEDLVADPHGAMARLASWLEIEYDPHMVDGVPRMNSSFNTGKSLGMWKEPTERWRTRLSAIEVAVIQSCCGRLMRQLGYEPVSVRAPAGSVATAYLLLPVAVARAFAANRYRIADGLGYCWRRLHLALGPAR